jgi:thioredoxin-like negative regulator of GroEL
MQQMQRAVELAPFDLGLRMSLALQQMRQGQAEAARGNLLPVAYDPHGGGRARQARRILASLNAVPGAAQEGGGDAGAAKSHR